MNWRCACFNRDTEFCSYPTDVLAFHWGRNVVVMTVSVMSLLDAGTLKAPGRGTVSFLCGFINSSSLMKGLKQACISAYLWKLAASTTIKHFMVVQFLTNDGLVVYMTFTCVGPDNVKRCPISCLTFTSSLFRWSQKWIRSYEYYLCSGDKDGRTLWYFCHSYLYMLQNFVKTECVNYSEIYCERVKDFKKLGEGGVNKEKKCFKYSLSVLVCPTLRPTEQYFQEVIVTFRATIMDELQLRLQFDSLNMIYNLKFTK